MNTTYHGICNDLFFDVIMLYFGFKKRVSILTPRVHKMINYTLKNLEQMLQGNYRLFNHFVDTWR